MVSGENTTIIDIIHETIYIARYSLDLKDALIEMTVHRWVEWSSPTKYSIGTLLVLITDTGIKTEVPYAWGIYTKKDSAQNVIRSGEKRITYIWVICSNTMDIHVQYMYIYSCVHHPTGSFLMQTRQYEEEKKIFIRNLCFINLHKHVGKLVINMEIIITIEGINHKEVGQRRRKRS